MEGGSRGLIHGNILALAWRYSGKRQTPVRRACAQVEISTWDIRNTKEWHTARRCVRLDLAEIKLMEEWGKLHTNERKIRMTHVALLTLLSTKNQKGDACGWHWNAHTIFILKERVKMLLRRPMHKWAHHSKTDFRKHVSWVTVDGFCHDGDEHSNSIIWNLCKEDNVRLTCLYRVQPVCKLLCRLKSLSLHAWKHK